MALTSGLASQIGWAIEGTPGTRATPTKFVPYLSENLALTVERIQHRGMRAGRLMSYAWSPGVQYVSGGFTYELSAQTAATFFGAALGDAVTTTGAGPYVHTYNPNSGHDTQTLTIQVGRPDADGGTVRPFDYTGCSVTDWEVSATSYTEPVTATMNVYGQHEDRAQSLASASYSATFAPFTFRHGTVTIAGSAAIVKSFTVRGNNNLVTGRHQMQATNPERPRLSKNGGMIEVTGEVVLDFTTLTAYERFVNGTEAALVLDLTTAATNKVVMTANVRYDGSTPNVTGPDSLVELRLPFFCTSSTSDAAAFTVAVTNNDATP